MNSTNIKELRSKISSIRNIQKITKVMETIAISKIRRSQNRIVSSRPYADTILELIKHILDNNLEYKKHPYLKRRNIKRIGYLVISSDRGLCGNLNTNLFKKILTDRSKWLDQGIQSEFFIIGSKGVSFFNSINVNIFSQAISITDCLSQSRIISLVKMILRNYDNNILDKVYIGNNKFITTISYIPSIIQLLPIELEKKVQSKSWNYLYESDAKVLLNDLINRYIESQVYQSIIENLASEQSARMVAMGIATNNSNTLIKKLQLIYNKTRQASITQGINEMISGSSVF